MHPALIRIEDQLDDMVRRTGITEEDFSGFIQHVDFLEALDYVIQDSHNVPLTNEEDQICKLAQFLEEAHYWYYLRHPEYQKKLQETAEAIRAKLEKERNNKNGR